MALDLVVEVSHRSLNKHGQEICGDWVKVSRTKDSTLIVVSDGLGSGVKANILATLTTEIATSMFRHGADLAETIETIAATLPICKVRNVAYATFTLLHIGRGRSAYLVEYDNPALFLLRGNAVLDVPRTRRSIGGRVVQEASFDLQEDDYLVCVSDGVVHAGVGTTLALGWTWSGVAEFLRAAVAPKPTAHVLAERLLERCCALYANRPGDDVTVAATRVRPAVQLTLLTGPPSSRSADAVVVERFMQAPGQKVVCGGATANMVARVLNRAIEPILDAADCGDIPPVARLPGVGLVTEGIVTMHRAIEHLQAAEVPEDLPARKDGAVELARALLQADNIGIMVGDAINPLQVADVIRGKAFRQVLVDGLVRELQRIGKVVDVEHY